METQARFSQERGAVSPAGAISSGKTSPSVPGYTSADERPPSYVTSEARDCIEEGSGAAPGSEGRQGPGATDPDLRDPSPRSQARSEAEASRLNAPCRPDSQESGRIESLRSLDFDEQDESILSVLSAGSHLHKRTAATDTGATSTDFIPCIYGFPAPPATRLVGPLDSIPVDVDAALDQNWSFLAEISTLSNRGPSASMSIQEASADAAPQAMEAEQAVSPLLELNAWRRIIRECADSAEAAADRICTVKRTEAIAEAVAHTIQESGTSSLSASQTGSDSIGASTTEPSLQPASTLSSSGHHTCSSGPSSERSRTTDAEPSDSIGRNGSVCLPLSFDHVPDPGSQAASVVPAESARSMPASKSERASATTSEEAASSTPPPKNGVAVEDAQSSIKRRGTFGQAFQQVEDSGNAGVPSETRVADTSTPSDEVRPTSSYASSRSGSIQGALSRVSEVKRRSTSLAGTSPFSLSLTASHMSDDTEYISDELCPEPDPGTGTESFASSTDQLAGVPPSVVKQFLTATVGKTRAAPKSSVHLGPLQVLHREMAKLRISTLLNVVNSKTSEVVCDLIANQIVAYLYFVEDSELLAWTTKTLFQRRDPPHRQWSQICQVLSEYRPLQPPASNFATYLAAPTRTAILRHMGFPDHLPVSKTPSPAPTLPHTPPASPPWRKHLHLFGRKHPLETTSKEEERGPHSVRSTGRASSFDVLRDVRADTDSLSGINADVLTEFITSHLKNRAVHCLNLDVLVAISNLCLHRVFAPILLRRLLALFALGDTENGFLPIEAEVKLLRDFREQYLRPQAALLRARIKEFSLELEVEAMLRAFEAAMHPHMYLPTFAQPFPFDSATTEAQSALPVHGIGISALNEWDHEDISQSASVLCSAYATPLWPCGGVGEAPPSKSRSEADHGADADEATPPASTNALSRKVFQRGPHARSRSTSAGTSVSLSGFGKPSTAEGLSSAHRQGSFRSNQASKPLPNRPRPMTSSAGLLSNGQVVPRFGSKEMGPINMVTAIDELVNLRQRAMSPRNA